MNCCDQDCHQGRDCPIRATRRVRAGQPAPELPVQFAEPEPDQEFGFDWVDFAILGGALAVVFTLGFGLGRAWA